MSDENLGDTLSERKSVRSAGGTGGSGGGGGVIIFNPTKLLNEGRIGESFEGRYEGFHEEERQTAKGKKFTSSYYKFIADNGQTIIADSAGHFKYLMDRALEVQPGEYCRVEYCGKDANDYHKYLVDVVE